tara:strand:+ start:119 stop:259 length:141 start_codon:yes stop_codon:yes gene_type:complete
MGKRVLEILNRNIAVGFFKEKEIIDKYVLFKSKCRIIPFHFIKPLR